MKNKILGYALLTSLFINPITQAAEVIKVDGSSTVFPITEAMAEEFQNLKKGSVNVTVGISGTGGGFKKFCRGETDIQDASRPISKSEMEACKNSGVKFIELPVAYDATVVVVHPKNEIKEIKVEYLKTMWAPEAQGKITQWKQINAQFPEQALKLYGAGADSGTFDYFTEAIVGKAKSSRGDYTASEDDNTIVNGVANDKGALGYIPLAYYEENKKKMKALGIIPAGKTAAVLPSRKTVEDGSYQPLSRPIFIYVNQASLSKKEISEFTEFYLKNAFTLVPQVKCIPLPEKIYKLGLENLKKQKLGTLFGGHSEIGLKIEDLMKKEGAL